MSTAEELLKQERRILEANLRRQAKKNPESQIFKDRKKSKLARLSRKKNRK